MGAKTKTGVQQFQRSLGLPGSGKVATELLMPLKGRHNHLIPQANPSLRAFRQPFSFGKIGVSGQGFGAWGQGCQAGPLTLRAVI